MKTRLLDKDRCFTVASQYTEFCFALAAHKNSASLWLLNTQIVASEHTGHWLDAAQDKAMQIAVAIRSYSTGTVENLTP